MEGTIWKHKKKGDRYYVLRIGKMENPTTQKWEECVVYCREDQSTVDIYVRSVKRFKERFVEVNWAPPFLNEAKED
jgi:hypothetical protein